VSYKLVDQILRTEMPELSAPEKWVLTYMARHAHDDGSGVFCGMTTIAGEACAFRHRRPLGSLAMTKPLNESTSVGRSRGPRTVVVGAMVSNAVPDAVEQFAAKRGWTLRVIADALAVHVSTKGFLDDEDASTPPHERTP
jgi:hypothetical protein